MATVLETVDDFRSVQELHEMLRHSGVSIGLTTVYRTLAALAEAGEVDALRTDAGETIYRRCRTSDHHHHLVCRGCGHTVEVEGPAVERWAEAVARANGFTDVSHTVEVFGTCATCAAGAKV